jgi:hypothetical protein
MATCPHIWAESKPIHLQNCNGFTVHAQKCTVCKQYTFTRREWRDDDTSTKVRSSTMSLDYMISSIKERLDAREALTPTMGLAISTSPPSKAYESPADKLPISDIDDVESEDDTTVLFNAIDEPNLVFVTDIIAAAMNGHTTIHPEPLRPETPEPPSPKPKRLLYTLMYDKSAWHTAGTGRTFLNDVVFDMAESTTSNYNNTYSVDVDPRSVNPCTSNFKWQLDDSLFDSAYDKKVMKYHSFLRIWSNFKDILHVRCSFLAHNYRRNIWEMRKETESIVGGFTEKQLPFWNSYEDIFEHKINDDEDYYCTHALYWETSWMAPLIAFLEDLIEESNQIRGHLRLRHIIEFLFKECCIAKQSRMANIFFLFAKFHGIELQLNIDEALQSNYVELLQLAKHMNPKQFDYTAEHFTISKMLTKLYVEMPLLDAAIFAFMRDMFPAYPRHDEFLETLIESNNLRVHNTAKELICRYQVHVSHPPMRRSMPVNCIISCDESSAGSRDGIWSKLYTLFTRKLFLVGTLEEGCWTALLSDAQ